MINDPQYYPLISIVTVVLNAEQYLEDTILNVARQKGPEIEYLIIDGGSTDGTPKIIQKHIHYIDFMLSESDEGIYDAMNKGIQHAHGELIVMLNAGDMFLPQAFDMIAALYKANNKRYGIYYGDSILLTDHDRQVYRPATVVPWQGMTICHQAMFVHRDVYRSCGRYHLQYRFAADFHFFLRTVRANVPFIHLPEAIVLFRDHGLGEQNKYKSLAESLHGVFSVFGFRSVIAWGYLMSYLQVCVLFQLGRLLRLLRRPYTSKSNSC